MTRFDSDTDTRPGNETGRFALLTDAPDRFESLAATLRQYTPGRHGEVSLWTAVERFRAPSGTHPPYRGLARTEARNITADRVAASEAQANLVAYSLANAGWDVRVEVILDAGVEAISFRLGDNGIGLLVTEGGTRLAESARTAAALAGCALLLLPSHADEDGGVSYLAGLFGRKQAAPGRLRVFHG
jgi:hypothetical protein